MLVSIDHIVLNCKDVERTADWYESVLGLKREVFGPDNRTALKFGSQKINLRPIGAEDWLSGKNEVDGAADICFITEERLSVVASRLHQAGAEVILGPVTRTGSLGPMTSIYLRDPEGSLLELSTYDDNQR